MKNIASKHSSLSEKITAIVFFSLFIIIAFLNIYPLFWAINNSLKTFEHYMENSFLITKDSTIEGDKL